MALSIISLVLQARLTSAISDQDGNGWSIVNYHEIATLTILVLSSFVHQCNQHCTVVRVVVADLQTRCRPVAGA